MRETSGHGLKSLRLSLKVMSVEQLRRPGRDFSIQKCPRPYDTKAQPRFKVLPGSTWIVKAEFIALTLAMRRLEGACRLLSDA